MKLHLGSGSHYIDGYVNIDLPASSHTVATPRVDLVADFTKLTYAPGSIEEIRLHHVFEHFTRARALGLLLAWRRWLAVDGILHIETPDFDRCLWYYLFSGAKAKSEILRHIFGSQEAHWANHYDGWSARQYRQVLTALGFTITAIERRSNSLSTRYNTRLFNWLGLLIPNALYRRFGMNKLPNITVIARKTSQTVHEPTALRKLLSQYLVGTEGDELLAVWLREVGGE